MLVLMVIRGRDGYEWESSCSRSHPCCLPCRGRDGNRWEKSCSRSHWSCLPCQFYSNWLIFCIQFSFQWWFTASFGSWTDLFSVMLKQGTVEPFCSELLRGHILLKTKCFRCPQCTLSVCKVLWRICSICGLGVFCCKQQPHTAGMQTTSSPAEHVAAFSVNYVLKFRLSDLVSLVYAVSEG